MYIFQYEDFEVLSQTAREVWLAEQCSAFETQIQALSREREKDHFLEELYRKLKQVTRRWQSWNHRSFGGVTSRGCVYRGDREAGSQREVGEEKVGGGTPKVAETGRNRKHFKILHNILQ